MNFIKTLIIALITLTCFIALNTSGLEASPRLSVYVSSISKPGPNYVWVAGHYTRNKFGKLVWVPGHWKKI